MPHASAPGFATASLAPVPILVGVVGHRDIRPEDCATLRAAATDVLTTIRAPFGDTKAILFTALAEGADRLVAEVALDAGYALHVALPMSRAIYEEEFTDDASRAAFRELLARAERVIELGDGAEAAARDPRAAALHHASGYRRLSAYLATNTYALLALWDGVDSDLAGGTADAVRLRVSGDEALGTGPVYHIVTPRRGAPMPDTASFTVKVLYRDDLADEDARRRQVAIEERLLRFNEQLGRELARASAPRRRLVPEGVLRRLPPGLLRTHEAFGVTDRLAQWHKARALRVLVTMLGLAFTALFCFELYAYYFYYQPAILLLYVAPVLAAYVVYLIARRHDYENCHLDYRALAEGLRVQFFWDLLGREVAVADRYLRMQQGELDWIRYALRAWRHLHAPGPDGVTTAESLPLALTHWIRSEWDYYRAAAARDQRRLQRIRRWSDVFFLGGMVLAGLHVALQLLVNLQPYYLVLISMSLLLILAGLFVVYQEKRGFATQSKQYARMHDVFSRAERRLTACLGAGRHAEALVIADEIGFESLAENGDWVLLHRDRPLEVPKIG